MGAADVNKWGHIRDPQCNCIFCIGGQMNLFDCYGTNPLQKLFELDDGWIQYEVTVYPYGGGGVTVYPYGGGGSNRMFFQPMRPGCLVARGLTSGVQYTHTGSGKIIKVPGQVFGFSPNHPYSYEDDWMLPDKLGMKMAYPTDIAKHPFKGRETPRAGVFGRNLPNHLPTPPGCTLQGSVNAINSVWGPKNAAVSPSVAAAAKELAKTGYRCTQCGEENPYASANQPNGTYVCSYHGVKLFA